MCNSETTQDNPAFDEHLAKIEASKQRHRKLLQESEDKIGLLTDLLATYAVKIDSLEEQVQALEELVQAMRREQVDPEQQDEEDMEEPSATEPPV